MTTPAAEQLLLTIQQTAATLACGRTTVFRLIATGQLEAVGTGRSRRIIAESATQYVERIRTHTDSGEPIRTQTVATQQKPDNVHN